MQWNRYNLIPKVVSGGSVLVNYSYLADGTTTMTPMLYASARWLTLDPLANKYYGISPYAFCANTPINFVDPDGNSWGKAFKVVKKIYKTVKAGVSGGKKTKGGKSYRGESQVRKWIMRRITLKN